MTNLIHGTVTAIEQQKRRPKADVYLDGAYAFTLRLDVIAPARIAAGDKLTPERCQELQAEDQRLGAIEAALRLLAVGPRSERDLRDRLRRKGFGREAVDHAITRMRDLGYLDDAAFARSFVEARQASTPRSRRALAFELDRRGIDRELVATAVAELSDEDAAYDAAQRRLRALRGLDQVAFTRRLGTFLASRGFSYGVARTTIERCWREAYEIDEAKIAGAGIET
jgi:regulatory protein